MRCPIKQHRGCQVGGVGVGYWRSRAGSCGISSIGAVGRCTLQGMWHSPTSCCQLPAVRRQWFLGVLAMLGHGPIQASVPRVQRIWYLPWQACVQGLQWEGQRGPGRVQRLPRCQGAPVLCLPRGWRPGVLRLRSEAGGTAEAGCERPRSGASAPGREHLAMCVRGVVKLGGPLERARWPRQGCGGLDRGQSAPHLQLPRTPAPAEERAGQGARRVARVPWHPPRQCTVNLADRLRLQSPRRSGLRGRRVLRQEPNRLPVLLSRRRVHVCLPALLGPPLVG
mmetsp:Transcript_50944/g.163012  ORF Transcript_50944/g.163012 Transcript_50944/m.163012 type:complete len:281 (+) Transcript_50944:1147-1989(+)